MPKTTTPCMLDELLEVVQFLHQQGWTPATSSNFSCLAPDREEAFYISLSGKDKGTLAPEDFLTVNRAGKVLASVVPDARPSAETLLHAVIYEQCPNAGAVLHTHSIHGTVLSKLYEAEGGILLQNFEILKGFEGIQTHEARVYLPIFPNAQDMTALSQHVRTYLESAIDPVYGFMLAGHGVYTWGQTPAQAKRHIEVLEFLFACILQLKSHGYPDYS